MKIKITLIGESNIILPKGFNEIIQWFIYSSIKDEWLHDVGFLHGKRAFKLFCFSEILEKGHFNQKKKVFVFPNTISFIVSSPVDWILEKMAGGVFNNSLVNFGNNRLSLKEIAVLKSGKIDSSRIKVKTLSPIEVHTTFEVNGKKKTYYYNPKESDFSKLINENAKKKWTALYGKNCPYEMKIKPKDKIKKRVVQFGQKNSYVIVNGYVGIFELVGRPEFLQFIIDAGLGSRNSQGFGMVEVIGGK